MVGSSVHGAESANDEYRVLAHYLATTHDPCPRVLFHWWKYTDLRVSRGRIIHSYISTSNLEIEETRTVLLAMQQFRWFVVGLYKYEESDLCLGYILYCVSDILLMHGEGWGKICCSDNRNIYPGILHIKIQMSEKRHPF